MDYYYTSEPENAVPEKSDVSPKTHTPASPVKERGYRYYSTESGRWVNRDPIGEWGGANLYVFIRNNPISYIDLLGLECCTCLAWKFSMLDIKWDAGWFGAKGAFTATPVLLAGSTPSKCKCRVIETEAEWAITRVSPAGLSWTWPSKNLSKTFDCGTGNTDHMQYPIELSLRMSIATSWKLVFKATQIYQCTSSNGSLVENTVDLKGTVFGEEPPL